MEHILALSQWWLGLLIAGLIGLYLLITYPYDFFKDRGVPFAKNINPLFGNVLKTAFFLKSHILDIQEHYMHFKNARFFGHFEFLTPVYYIRDPQLIKQICVKDFDNFRYHRATIDEKVEPMLAKNLFLVKNKKWRPLRQAISPVFTGSKLREMFIPMGDYLRTIVNDLSEKHKDAPVELEMKDFFMRMGHDILANSTFGIESNSFVDRDNMFYMIGNKIKNFEGIKTWIFLSYINFPKTMKFLKIKFYGSDITEYMQNLSKTAIEERIKIDPKRTDFTNIVISAKTKGFHHEEITPDGPVKESQLSHWDEDDLASQFFIFHLAGLQMLSQVMCFATHELACNPEVQEKLRIEIDEVREQLNGTTASFDVIMKMKYLDMVVSETLRKWPPVVTVDRECTKPYVMEDHEGKKHYLQKGQGVVFPIFAIQNDPEYYRDPQKFEPERFSEERKHEIMADAYIPFGVGPRMCIGNRFSLMEAKISLFHLLSTFVIEKSPKTQATIELSNQAINLIPTKGFWLNMRVRCNVTEL